MAVIRKLFRFLVVLTLVVMAFAAGALAVYTLTATGRDNLAGLISKLASSDDRTVRISGIDGIWSNPLTIASVTVEDRNGAWLAIRSVEIDWSRLSLLSSAFVAERIAAQSVEIARAPLPADNAGAASGPPTLPVSLDVKKIDLPQILLGPALAGGRVASISANGRVTATPSPLAIEADVSAARTDGTAGDLDAQIAFAPADNVLGIDLRASEPAGGILASLLDLPGKPRVDILVSGSGPAANWKGSGTFAVDGTVITSLSASHRMTDRGSRVEATGDGDFARFLPQRLQSLLSGRSTFELAGTYTNAGAVAVERAKLDSSGLAVSASGTLDPEGASDFSLNFSAKQTSVPLSFGTEESPIDLSVASLSIRVAGPGKTPALDISARLPTVATNDTKLRELALDLHSDAFDLTARSGPVSGTATAAELTIDNPTISPLVAGAISARLAGKVSTEQLIVDAASLRSDAVDGSFAGAVSLADGSITLKLNADVQTSALPAAIYPVVGAKLTLSADLARDTSGNVSAKSLAFSSGPLSGQGFANLSDGRIEAQASGKLEDVSVLAPQASGAVALSLSASGALSGPDASVELTSERVVVANRAVEGLKVTASGRVDPANPAADVKIEGRVGGEALAGSAVLRTVNGRRDVQGLTLSLGENRIDGDLTLDEAFRPVGTIRFNLPDIGPLAALALETAEGSLTGSADFAVEGDVPRLTVSATSSALRRAESAVSDASIQAVVSNYLAAPAVSGTVKAGRVTYGKTVLTGVDVALSRDGSWTRFAAGVALNGEPVKADGRVRSEAGTTTVELSSASASFQGIAGKLSRATTIVIAGGRVNLDNAAIGVGGGTATVSGAAGETLNLTVVLSAVPASLANTFSPGLSATGSISGTVKVTGAAASPSIGYTIDWSGARTAQTAAAGFDAMTIRSSGTYAGNVLKFDANVGDGSGLTMKGGGTVGLGGTPQLSLKFAGAVPFSFLTQRLASQGLSLSGTSQVDLSVSGPATAPVVTGSLRASGARFVDARSGIAINDIALDIGLGSGRATIRRLTGALAMGGTLSASGTVGIAAAAGFPADLKIALRDGRYTDGEVVTTTASGDLTLTGPLVSAPAVKGTISLGRTVINIPEKMPGSLAALDVQHKNAPANVQAQAKALAPARSATGGGGLALDVAVNAPQQIFIQGRGLDAELGGSIRLAGPASAPQATGQFTMRRGRLAVLGKRLTFTRGTLGFSGSLVPYLDLAAESTATDATVTVLVTGPANNPKFTFSSIPSLPEDEVLARLVFGRSMSNLSPVQIAQLADAAAQFAGGGGTTSLLNTLRGKIGIDDLDIKTDEKGGTAISAGKYLNDRTYVTIEKGDKAGSGKAAIDLNIGKGLKLRGEATDEGKAKGGIFFEREY